MCHSSHGGITLAWKVPQLWVHVSQNRAKCDFGSWNFMYAMFAVWLNRKPVHRAASSSFFSWVQVLRSLSYLPFLLSCPFLCPSMLRTAEQPLQIHLMDLCTGLAENTMCFQPAQGSTQTSHCVFSLKKDSVEWWQQLWIYFTTVAKIAVLGALHPLSPFLWVQLHPLHLGSWCHCLWICTALCTLYCNWTATRLTALYPGWLSEPVAEKHWTLKRPVFVVIVQHL